ncbi:MAG: modification methylase [Acidobacteria bacterium]|nr:MAG: modification methylase [Acidobacteriota bacterium]
MMQALAKCAVAQRKATGAHFTPPDLAALLGRRLLAQDLAEENGEVRVLDPSCGDGQLLKALYDASPSSLRAKIQLIGVESDALSLERARDVLSVARDDRLVLVQGDFLSLAASPQGELPLFAPSSGTCGLRDPAHVIIANPPYVRTQILGSDQSQRLAATFGLAGRIDLYHAFLVAMTRQLVPGGLLGVITSNRFLTTRGGQSVRDFLRREFEIIEILDLGDTKLFEAAVLPAVFIGRRRKGPHRHSVATPPVAKFVRIYEQCEQSDSLSIKQARSVCELLDVPKAGPYTVGSRRFTGELCLPSRASEPWSMLTEGEQKWMTRLTSNSQHRVSQFAKVRVGVKSTADEVFIRADWHMLPEDIRPESEILFPILSHREAAPWRPLLPDKHARRILYTHEVKHGKRRCIDISRFPRAAAYLESHKNRLARRQYVAEANRLWYEIWVPQDPRAWNLPKIVFPDISAEPRFFFDGEGRLVDGDCYWITLREGVHEDVLFLIMALANSHLMARYHDLAFQNKLYSGRRRYFTQFVEKYPLPDPASNEARRLVLSAKELAFNVLPTEQGNKILSEIEQLALAAFRVEPVTVAMQD